MSQPPVYHRPIAPKPATRTHQEAAASSSQVPSQLPGLPDQPPIVPDPIPMKDRVTLYFRTLGVSVAVVNELIWVKTREKPGLGEQNDIMVAALKSSENEDHTWEWNPKNVGRYIASGITQPTDLNMTIGLMKDEIGQVKNGEGSLPPGYRAREKDSDVYKGVTERFKENRRHFPERVDEEDRIRKANHPQVTPMSPEELKLQWEAAGKAAVIHRGEQGR